MEIKDHHTYELKTDMFLKYLSLDYDFLAKSVVAWMNFARLMWNGSSRLLKFDWSQRMRSGMEHGQRNPGAKAGIPLNDRDQWVLKRSVPAGTLQPPSGPIRQYSCLEISRKLNLMLQTDSKKKAILQCFEATDLCLIPCPASYPRWIP